jgi:hypothetical protein
MLHLDAIKFLLVREDIYNVIPREIYTHVQLSIFLFFFMKLRKKIIVNYHLKF